MTKRGLAIALKGGAGRSKGKITKRQEETFGSNGYIYYVDCDDSLTAAHTGPNSAEDVLSVWAVYGLSIIP